jgi:hypothetical protein
VVSGGRLATPPRTASVFLPSQDGSQVVCLWEGDSVEAVQGYVDGVLGNSSINSCFAVNAEPAFAERPLGLATRPLALR